MIDDIVQEQAQAGELDEGVASDLGYSPQRQIQNNGQSGQPQMMSGTRYRSVQVPNDAEFWVEVAILLVLIGIFLKL